MPKGYVRKRCADCRAASPGRADKMEWCDRCGGEMRPIKYQSGHKRRVRRG